MSFYGHHGEDPIWTPSGGSGGGGGGGGGGGAGGGFNDARAMMEQMAKLQRQVLQMTRMGGGGGASGGGGGGRGSSWSDPGGATRDGGGYFNQMDVGPPRGRGGGDGGGGHGKVLLVTNLPPHLQNPDSVFFMLEKFGTVERVKILNKKRSTALVQMMDPEAAAIAVENRDFLRRCGAEIYVTFSTNISFVKMPSDNGSENDGNTKDYTVHNNCPPPPPNDYYDDYHGNDDRGGGGGSFNGSVLLISNVPEELAKPDFLCNLFGMYGDVVRVKILRNRRDCALIQMAKPHYANNCKTFLDQAPVESDKLCVSYSRMEAVKMPNDAGHEGDQLTKDYSNAKNAHRYKQHSAAAKLQKNLCPPTSVIHVANLDESVTEDEVKQYFIEKGFTVKEMLDCGSRSGMALLQLGSPAEALMALATLHNDRDLKSKKDSGICITFSKRKARQDNNISK